MSFSFKLLFRGSAPTSALNLLKFLVPWDPLSGGRNNLLYQLYTVFILFLVSLELGEQLGDWVPHSNPSVPRSAFLRCGQ